MEPGGPDRQFIGLRTLKTAVAAGIAIFIATLIGLSYVASAGIIVILSVQNTKRRSSELARQRLVATLIALFLSSVVYRLIGFNPCGFCGLSAALHPHRGPAEIPRCHRPLFSAGVSPAGGGVGGAPVAAQ